MLTLTTWTTEWRRLLPLSYRPGTVRNYDRYVRCLVDALGPATGLATVTAIDVVRALEVRRAAAGSSPGTLRNYLIGWSTCFEDARAAGLIAVNPARGVGRRLRGMRMLVRPKALTAEELPVLLTAARQHSPRLAPLLDLLARTGLRLGEALGLRIGDVDLDGPALRIVRTWHDGGRVGPPKSAAARRRVDLSPAALALVQQLAGDRDSGDWLFGAPWNRAYVARTVVRIAARAGIERRVTPHHLRHTYATLLLASGAPLEMVSRQLGHSKLAITLDLYGKDAHIPLGHWAAVVDEFSA
jgi:integrase